jgi:hypothetical protein
VYDVWSVPLAPCEIECRRALYVLFPPNKRDRCIENENTTRVLPSM